MNQTLLVQAVLSEDIHFYNVTEQEVDALQGKDIQLDATTTTISCSNLTIHLWAENRYGNSSVHTTTGAFHAREFVVVKSSL
jgi:hypothetical protein